MLIRDCVSLVQKIRWGPFKELRRKLLIRIGDNPGDFKLTDLGIKKGELCFQWFLLISAGVYIVYPLVE